MDDASRRPFVLCDLRRQHLEPRQLRGRRGAGLGDSRAGLDGALALERQGGVSPPPRPPRIARDCGRPELPRRKRQWGAYGSMSVLGHEVAAVSKPHGACCFAKVDSSTMAAYADAKCG